MNDSTLRILNNPAVADRVSQATRQVLEQRVEPIQAPRYLSPKLYSVLQQVVATILPQETFGTNVDIAAVIDDRLAQGKGSGWRFADLPVDGEAYAQGLDIFATMLDRTPMKQFDRMPVAAREDYLRCVADGDVDAAARFPLSKWLLMLKTDAVKAWLSHPATMQKIGYYGFADGATGATDGPTPTEGWSTLTPGNALSFEQERRA